MSSRDDQLEAVVFKLQAARGEVLDFILVYGLMHSETKKKTFLRLRTTNSSKKIHVSVQEFQSRRH